MRILTNDRNDELGLTTTTLERDLDESLLSYNTDGFFRVNGMVFSGHDIGSMQPVAWDAAAQEWKVVR